MPLLEGKVSLITGAASGIGLATALRFGKAGSRLALLDKDEAGLDELAEHLPHENVLALAIDVSDEGSVKLAVRSAVERFGQLDAVVNHAAILDNWGPPAGLPHSLWEEVLSTNLYGVVHVCRAAVEVMGTGSIINTGSVCGVTRACPSRSPYNAAKGALVSFTRDLSAAYGPSGIRANVVVPGFIETPMSSRLVAGHEDQAEAERKRIPLRRLGLPEEVASACLFLASEEASYVSGSVLNVDGGISLV